MLLLFCSDFLKVYENVYLGQRIVCLYFICFVGLCSQALVIRFFFPIHSSSLV